MKHSECDVGQQISIQGIHLGAFWKYFWEREGSLNINITAQLCGSLSFRLIWKTVLVTWYS